MQSLVPWLPLSATMSLAILTSLLWSSTPASLPPIRPLADLLFVATQNLSLAVSIFYGLRASWSVLRGSSSSRALVSMALVSSGLFVFLSAGPWQDMLSAGPGRISPLRSPEEEELLKGVVRQGWGPSVSRVPSALVPSMVALSLDPGPVMLDYREVTRRAGAPARLGEGGSFPAPGFDILVPHKMKWQLAVPQQFMPAYPPRWVGEAMSKYPAIHPPRKSGSKRKGR